MVVNNGAVRKTIKHKSKSGPPYHITIFPLMKKYNISNTDT